MASQILGIVIDCMRRFPEDQVLQERACYAVGSLCRGSDEIVAAFRLLPGATTEVIRAATQYPDSPHIQTARAALAGLVFLPPAVATGTVPASHAAPRLGGDDDDDDAMDASND